MANEQTKPGPDERLTMYRQAEVALREFFSASNYCLENCITQECSKIAFFIPIPGRLGCCTENCFDRIPDDDKSDQTMQTTKRFIELQKENATCQAHREGECDYHSETGCQIKRYLTPLCLGFICSHQREYLEKNYGIQYPKHMIGVSLKKIIQGDERQVDLNVWLAKLKQATARVKKGKENQDPKQEVITIIPST
ncbi:MAG: hypothetical protein WCI72_02125 [archaeon]